MHVVWILVFSGCKKKFTCVPVYMVNGVFFIKINHIFWVDTVAQINFTIYSLAEFSWNEKRKTRQSIKNVCGFIIIFIFKFPILFFPGRHGRPEWFISVIPFIVSWQLTFTSFFIILWVCESRKSYICSSLLVATRHHVAEKCKKF